MVTLILVTDFNYIQKIESLWNNDFAPHFKNPALFSRFFCRLMHFSETKGWTPLIFTFWSKNQLVGVAPLKVRKRFNITYANILDDNVCSEMFLFDEYRDQCINILFDILFNKLKFTSVTLTLESQHNVKALKNNCPKNLNYSEKIGPGKAVITIEKSYDQFYNSLKKRVRKHFRKIRRKFDLLESWEVNCVDINSESIKKILTVDQNSWKAVWRRNNNLEEDNLLHTILDVSQKNEEIEPIYEPKVWFLEANGKPIAYQIVLRYKGKALFIKTSYDAGFKKYSPGSFLDNFVIEKFFKNSNVDKIDFVTNLSFVQVWNPTCQNRIQVTIVKKSLGFSLIRKVLKIIIEIGKRHSFSDKAWLSSRLEKIESKIPTE